jgi:hypothetical protein
LNVIHHPPLLDTPPPRPRGRMLRHWIDAVRTAPVSPARRGALDDAAISLAAAIRNGLPAGAAEIVQLVACDGAQSSAIVDALALLFAGECGTHPLLVDATENGVGPQAQAPSLAAALLAGSEAAVVVSADPNLPRLSHARLAARSDEVRRLGQAGLARMMQSLSADHDPILIDGGRWDPAGGAAALCRLSSAVVLVVRAGDREERAREAMRDIAQAGGRLLGAVFQDAPLG